MSTLSDRAKAFNERMSKGAPSQAQQAKNAKVFLAAAKGKRAKSNSQASTTGQRVRARGGQTRG